MLEQFHFLRFEMGLPDFVLENVILEKTLLTCKAQLDIGKFTMSARLTIRFAISGSL